MQRIDAVFRHLVVTAFALSSLASPALGQIRARTYGTGFSVPLAFVADPSDTTVQYVVEQRGRIRVVKNGVVQPTDFLNLSGAITTGGERGLLGLAFPPGDVTDRRFFVNFTNLQGHTVIARFLRSTGDRLRADPATRFDLRWPDGNRFITQPFSNHNGGTLMFGPDGYLYIGMGDGGSGNDPNGYAQNPNSLLGKMLRIEVRVPDADPEGYDVPADNPFRDGVPVSALGEIWAFGVRNPWKFSFDDPSRGGTGALVIADVGQGSYEEVDYEPPASGGRNYGWRNREGAHDNVTSTPPAFVPLIDPIFEYDHSVGQSITGGFVYRGTLLGPERRGRYFFADFIAGRVWSVALTIDSITGEATASGLTEHTAELGGTAMIGNISSFGVDASGELYIVSYSKGTIFSVLPPLPLMTIDTPGAGAVTQPFTTAGWAIDRTAASGPGVDAIHVWAYPSSGGNIFLGAAPYGGARPDVGAVFGSQFTNSAFGLDVRGLVPGNYQIATFAHSTVTGTFNNSQVVNVSVRNNPRMAIDTPAQNATLGPTFSIAGWALDLAAPSGSGIDAVHIWAYPNPGSGAPPVFLGAAAYGSPRPDVGAAYGSQFTNSAFSLSVSNLALGRYQVVVFAHSTVSGTFDNAMALNVTLASDPRMVVDAPAPGTVTRPFQLVGWAVDLTASSGSGVDAVHVWAYPTSGAPPVFVGSATMGVSRPDIGQAFGAQFGSAGFNLTVGSLSQGTYDLAVYAHSTVTVTFNNVRVVRVTVQ